MGIDSTLKRELREVLATLVRRPDRASFSTQDILDSFIFPVAVVDRHGKILTVNKSWMQPVWRTGLLDDVSPGPGADYLKTCRQAAKAGIVQADEALRIIRGVCDGSMRSSNQVDYPSPSPGEERWFSMTVTPLSGREGAVISIRDTTESRRIEAGLRESERLLQIANEVPAMIWMAAPDRRCIYFNKQWLEFTGRRLDQELDYGWMDGIHPDDMGTFQAVFEEAFERRHSFRLEHRLRCSNGTFRWVLNTGVPFLQANGEFTGFAGSCNDTTDRRATEETLIDLGGRLINAQEEERRRVARELHDNLSQKMALLAIEIEQLAQLPSHSAEEIDAGLRNLLDKVQELSSEIHRISYALHPWKLDRLGLAAAILSLCNEASNHQSLQVQCDFENIPDRLPRDVALCLYRVIQESLQNIIKHSGAYAATVDLRGSPSEIRLRITDEGVGFEPESAVRKPGLGLLSMRERLRIVGGTISIESQPLRGTRINVVVPLR